jgi:hypothetical protein
MTGTKKATKQYGSGHAASRKSNDKRPTKRRSPVKGIALGDTEILTIRANRSVMTTKQYGLVADIGRAALPTDNGNLTQVAEDRHFDRPYKALACRLYDDSDTDTDEDEREQALPAVVTQDTAVTATEVSHCMRFTDLFVYTMICSHFGSLLFSLCAHCMYRIRICAVATM